MAEALAIVPEERPLTAAEIKAQTLRIQEVMKAVMKEGHHYGKIPGCGDKPALYKPGAEKLMMTFRLAADPQIIEVPTEDGITFRVLCRVTTQASGIFLGSGVGECSTKEEKYNWKKAVCDGEFNETPEDRRRLKWGKGGNGKPDYQIKQIRTNPADVANTVLKMAKKRALVDAILTVTAASDIFDQDLEDLSDELKGNDETDGRQKKTDSVKPAGNNAPSSGGPVINEKQGKLVYARLKNKGISEADLKTAFGISSIKDIPAAKMNEVLAWIDNPTKANKAETPADLKPPECTDNPNSCPHSTWDSEGKPLCGDKPCPFWSEV